MIISCLFTVVTLSHCEILTLKNDKINIEKKNDQNRCFKEWLLEEKQIIKSCLYINL